MNTQENLPFVYERELADLQEQFEADKNDNPLIKRNWRVLDEALFKRFLVARNGQVDLARQMILNHLVCLHTFLCCLFLFFIPRFIFLCVIFSFVLSPSYLDMARRGAS